jgi:hypothetical protein
MPDLETRYQSIENKLDQKADKADLVQLEARLTARMDEIMSVLDHIVRELSIIRTEQKAMAVTLSLQEEESAAWKKKSLATAFAKRI